MGLDIRLYRGLSEISEKQYEDEDSGVYTYQIEEEWKDRNTIFKNEAYYNYKEFLFHISYSYGTHSRFRDYLQKIQELDVDWIKVKDKKTPFYYLFDFGDNEGCFDFYIGSKLLKDFISFKDKNNKSGDLDMIELYNEWLEMLKLMKETDLVNFS